MSQQAAPGITYYFPEEAQGYPGGLFDYGQGMYYAPAPIDMWMINGAWVPASSLGQQAQPQQQAATVGQPMMASYSGQTLYAQPTGGNYVTPPTARGQTGLAPNQAGQPYGQPGYATQQPRGTPMAFGTTQSQPNSLGAPGLGGTTQLYAGMKPQAAYSDLPGGGPPGPGWTRTHQGYKDAVLGRDGLWYMNTQYTNPNSPSRQQTAAIQQQSSGPSYFMPGSIGRKPSPYGQYAPPSGPVFQRSNMIVEADDVFRGYIRLSDGDRARLFAMIGQGGVSPQTQYPGGYSPFRYSESYYMRPVKLV